MFDDPRVTSFWDGDRLAGRWLANHETGSLSAPGSIVWDAYFGYGPRARWRGAPSEPIVAGSDIIAHTAGLERFAATL
jgi:hypothetical protein